MFQNSVPQPRAHQSLPWHLSSDWAFQAMAPEVIAWGVQGTFVVPLELIPLSLRGSLCLWSGPAGPAGPLWGGGDCRVTELWLSWPWPCGVAAASRGSRQPGRMCLSKSCGNGVCVCQSLRTNSQSILWSISQPTALMAHQATSSVPAFFAFTFAG